MQVFDIKLKDGRYFKNVIIAEEFSGIVEEIETILDFEYTEDGRVEKYVMEIYKESDYDCTNCLVRVCSDDIEYICKAYKYKELISKL